MSVGVKSWEAKSIHIHGYGRFYQPSLQMQNRGRAEEPEIK